MFQKQLTIYFRSIIFYILVAFNILSMFFTITISFFFTKKIFSLILQCHCKFFLFLSEIILGFKYNIKGNMPKIQCIIAPQHQSSLDSVIMMAHISDASFLYQSSLKRNPIMWLISKKLRMIPVISPKKKKNNQFKTIKYMAREVFQLGRKLVIFPQGGHSSKSLLPIRKGVFFLHKIFKLPIVPIKLTTGSSWSKGFFKKPSEIFITIYKPIFIPDVLEYEKILTKIYYE